MVQELQISLWKYLFAYRKKPFLLSTHHSPPPNEERILTKPEQMLRKYSGLQIKVDDSSISWQQNHL